MDTAREHGLAAVAQVDLGRRGHKHQASHDLAVMAAELLLVAERRRQGSGPQLSKAPSSNSEDPVYLRQFVRVNGEMRKRSRPVPMAERPPARSVRGAGGAAGP
jgi:glucosyl-3-phosphoglycerate synthase